MNEMKILDWKIQCKIKKCIEEINDRLDTTEEKISELECRPVEIIQREAKRGGEKKVSFSDT